MPCNNGWCNPPFQTVRSAKYYVLPGGRVFLSRSVTFGGNALYFHTLTTGWFQKNSISGWGWTPLISYWTNIQSIIRSISDAVDGQSNCCWTSALSGGVSVAVLYMGWPHIWPTAGATIIIHTDNSHQPPACWRLQYQWKCRKQWFAKYKQPYATWESITYRQLYERIQII